MGRVYGGLHEDPMLPNHLMIKFSTTYPLEKKMMICPHCNVAIHEDFSEYDMKFCGRNPSGHPYYWYAMSQACPSCLNPIIYLRNALLISGRHFEHERFLVYPTTNSAKVRAPVEVPPAIATDYNEAALVMALSAQASAALSRRCLQHLLEDTGLSKNNNLNKAIEEAMSKSLPSHIIENLDAVRVIGNFAAHVQKSINTGEILPVDPHEAEWNLEVLDMLFDFCYVQPAKNAARRAALDAKLAEAGKPLLK